MAHFPKPTIASSTKQNYIKLAGLTDGQAERLYNHKNLKTWNEVFNAISKKLANSTKARIKNAFSIKVCKKKKGKEECVAKYCQKEGTYYEQFKNCFCTDHYESCKSLFENSPRKSFLEWIEEGTLDIADAVIKPKKRNAESEFTFLKMCLDFLRDAFAFIKSDKKAKYEGVLRDFTIHQKQQQYRKPKDALTEFLNSFFLDGVKLRLVADIRYIKQGAKSLKILQVKQNMDESSLDNLIYRKYSHHEQFKTREKLFKASENIFKSININAMRSEEQKKHFEYEQSRLEVAKTYINIYSKKKPVVLPPPLNLSNFKSFKSDFGIKWSQNEIQKLKKSLEILNWKDVNNNPKREFDKCFKSLKKIDNLRIPNGIPKKYAIHLRVDPFGNLIHKNAETRSVCKMNVDHVFPHSYGGPTHIDNLWGIHWRANKNVKNNKLMQEFDKEEFQTGLSEDQFYALLEYLVEYKKKAGKTHLTTLAKKVINHWLTDEPPGKEDQTFYFFMPISATDGKTIYKYLKEYHDRCDIS